MSDFRDLFAPAAYAFDGLTFGLGTRGLAGAASLFSDRSTDEIEQAFRDRLATEYDQAEPLFEVPLVGGVNSFDLASLGGDLATLPLGGAAGRAYNAANTLDFFRPIDQSAISFASSDVDDILGSLF